MLFDKKNNIRLKNGYRTYKTLQRLGDYLATFIFRNERDIILLKDCIFSIQ